MNKRIYKLFLYIKLFNLYSLTSKKYKNSKIINVKLL